MTSKQHQPICIASPVRRSGTTLIQRLLCSSPNALIYGESCANDFNLLLNLLTSKQLQFQHNKDWYNQQLQTVLEGNVNLWMPDLMPDIDGYLEAYKKMVHTHAEHFHSFAEQKGFSHWGMKMPEWNPSALVWIKQAMPATKIIYLHRNLEDCIRSAKAIDMIRGIQEVTQFCQIWKQYGDYARTHLNDELVLHMNYEDLIANPKGWIQTIENFTGVENINPTVLQAKVNTYDNDPKLKTTEDKYLKPAELTEEERSVIKSFSPVLEDS